jgi:hypothetical protein
VIPAAGAIFVCTVAVDLRAFFDRLAALARLHVGRDPLADGAIYLFLNRAHTHAKALWFVSAGESSWMVNSNRPWSTLVTLSPGG